MWIREIFLGFIGLAGGLSVSSGIFAFAVTLGIVPRFAGKTHTSNYVLSYETAILLGGILGTLMSIFELQVPLKMVLIVVFGLTVGIYNGCLAVALVEILDAFPIMFRRMKMKEGQSWVLYAMAFGKMAGALYFYAHHMPQ